MRRILEILVADPSVTNDPKLISLLICKKCSYEGRTIKLPLDKASLGGFQQKSSVQLWIAKCRVRKWRRRTTRLEGGIGLSGTSQQAITAGQEFGTAGLTQHFGRIHGLRAKSRPADGRVNSIVGNGTRSRQGVVVRSGRPAERVIGPFRRVGVRGLRGWSGEKHIPDVVESLLLRGIGRTLGASGSTTAKDVVENAHRVVRPALPMRSAKNPPPSASTKLLDGSISKNKSLRQWEYITLARHDADTRCLPASGASKAPAPPSYAFLAAKARSSRALRRSLCARASRASSSPSQVWRAGQRHNEPRVSLVPSKR